MVPVATIVSSFAAVAMAGWLASASLHIVGWQGEHARIVALLAPWSELIVALAITFVFGLAIVAVRHRFGGGSLHAVAATCGPLSLLWCWAIPYIPGVGARFPLLLVLAGPMRWVIAAVAGFGVALPLLTRWRWRSALRVPGRGVIFALTLGIFLGIGSVVTRLQPPNGDEPHYLVLAHSILVDGDLRIENNHSQRDYASFFPSELRPDFVQRGRDRVIYSIHAPGLPALLVPAYAVAGYPGAVAMMSLLAALAALAIFDLARLFAGGTAALATWALVMFTVPIVPLAWMIYPEVPALLVVAWAARWLAEPLPEQPTRWIVRGTVLAALPWLHTKFSLLLACLVIGLLVRLWPRVKQSAALMVPVVASIVGWLSASYVMYGVVDPTGPYGGLTDGLEVANIPRGILGLAFDQEFGVLLFTPVYLFGMVGLWRLLRVQEQRWLGLWLAGTATVFLAGVTQAYMWWGGSSSPGRFLVPIVPLIVPMIATALERFRGPVARGAMVATGVWSLAAVVIALALPGRMLLLEDRDGTGRFVEALQGGAPLSSTLASFIGADWLSSLGQVVPWIGAATLGFLLVRRAASWRLWEASGPAYRCGSLGIVGILVSGSILGSLVIPPSDRISVANRGRGRLMRAYDGGRLFGLSYDPLRRLSDDRILEQMSVAVSSEDRREIGSGHVLFGPFDLPAGRYEMWASYGDIGATAVPLSVVYYLREMRGVLVEDTATPDNRGRTSFVLPVSLPAVWARLRTSDVRRRVQEVRVIPQAVVPRHLRPDWGDDVRAIRRLDDASEAYALFVDDNTVPRDGHYWVRRRTTGTVLISAPDVVQPRVTITNTGGVPDLVRVESGDWAVDLPLEPGESRQLLVPRVPQQPLVTLAITTAAEPETAEAEPEGPNTQWVDCRVTIELISST